MREWIRPFAVTAWVLVSGCTSVSTTQAHGPQTVRLDRGAAGKPPVGFTTALTGGGGDAVWRTREDRSAAGGRVVVQESTDDTSYRFPLCVYDGVIARDVASEVKFKTLSGTVDQAAGLVLRYEPENYYVARANALEDNVNLFKTVDGNRLKIAEVSTKVSPGEWHTLAFSCRGPHLVVSFDGKVVIEQDDPTFVRPGKVALWTKSDSVTAFADLRIEADAK